MRPELSLGELLERLATEAEGVERRSATGRVEYLFRGQLFAAREDDDEARFRLTPDTARAAADTPGASRSAAGPEWVALRVTQLDRFAEDRARAWFEFALRRAGAGGGRADKKRPRPAGPESRR